MTIKHEFQPDLPPPPNTVGAVGWMRKNLFSSPLNSVMTIVLAFLAIKGLWALVDWAFINSDWVGTTREDCSREGACWVFINVRFEQFMFGFYPQEELWRPKLFYAILAIFTGALIYERTPKRGWILLLFIVLSR